MKVYLHIWGLALISHALVGGWYVLHLFGVLILVYSTMKIFSNEWFCFISLSIRLSWYTPYMVTIALLLMLSGVRD
jgi:hypothetical protein